MIFFPPFFFLKTCHIFLNWYYLGKLFGTANTVKRFSIAAPCLWATFLGLWCQPHDVVRSHVDSHSFWIESYSVALSAWPDSRGCVHTDESCSAVYPNHRVRFCDVAPTAPSGWVACAESNSKTACTSPISGPVLPYPPPPLNQILFSCPSPFKSDSEQSPPPPIKTKSDSLSLPTLAYLIMKSCPQHCEDSMVSTTPMKIFLYTLNSRYQIT